MQPELAPLPFELTSVSVNPDVKGLDNADIAGLILGPPGTLPVFPPGALHVSRMRWLGVIQS